MKFRSLRFAVIGVLAGSLLAAVLGIGVLWLAARRDEGPVVFQPGRRS